MKVEGTVNNTAKNALLHVVNFTKLLTSWNKLVSSYVYICS